MDFIPGSNLTNLRGTLIFLYNAKPTGVCHFKACPYLSNDAYLIRIGCALLAPTLNVHLG